MADRRLKRIQGEFNKLAKSKEAWLQAELVNEKVDEWKLIMKGPENTPYEGGNFQIQITFPDRYPHEPPKFKCITKIYTAIIDKETGSFCHPLFDQSNNANSWAPTNNVYEIILAFRTMLSEKSDHVFDQEIADLMVNNPALWEKTAREWTQKYAK